MVEALNRAGGVVTTLGFMLAALLASASAGAENLVDPTRPPAAPSGAVSVATAELVLQSVLISPGRMIAIINGQTVKLGDTFGDAKVVKISESEVVLRDGNNVQTLKLFPGIEKRLSSSHAGAGKANRQAP